MPAVTTKQIGIGQEIILDPIGAAEDLGADAVSFSHALVRTMLESNQLGHLTLRDIHGANDLTSALTLQQRANVALHDIFLPYTQVGALGVAPFLMSMSWLGFQGVAISATNRKWIFVLGTCPTIVGPSAAFNTVETVEFPIRWGDVGTQTSAGATYTSILTGTADDITNIADAPPV